MGARDTVLSLQGLSTHFVTARGLVRAVDDVAFDVPRGAAVGLVGESGSGKSTVALSILRLLGPGGVIAKGRVLFRGEDLLQRSEDELRRLRGNRLAIVFQDPLTSLTPSLTIGEQIAETILVHRKGSRRAAWDRAIELLDLVGLPDPKSRVRQYPHQFSGGMRQRVAIAIALSCAPDLVILDEPTTALDVTIQAQVLDLLARLREELNLSILFISHDLGVIARVCDRVAVLYGGRLLEEASIADLFLRPLHPYTKGLLACVPDLTSASQGRRLPHIVGRIPDLVDPPAGCIFHPRCPFAEQRCRDEPQQLAPVGVEHRVACWKSVPMADQPWPVAAGGLATGRRATGQTLVTIERLSKEFRLSGFWDSWRLRRNGRALPRLVVESKRLRAVDEVSLTIRVGETFGLVGESGCGKSTLGHTVVGLITPTHGEVRLDGCNLIAASRVEQRRYRKDVQIIFQDPDSSLNPRKTVGQILARPLELYRLASGARLRQRVPELLETVQLSPSFASRYPHQLSGGEKQRVGIARALAAEPKFIVCDEPISALDVSVRASILNLLGDLRQRFGLAYLFIAHDLAVVRHISDRIAVMYRGRVCETGRVDEVFSPPYHPYTWALLSAIPIPEYAARTRERVRLRGNVTGTTAARSGCVFRDRCPVRIGPICDDVEPANSEVKPGHWIACHQPVEFLQTLDPMLPAATVGTAT